MPNPFHNVAFITVPDMVVATTKSGCTIYLPVGDPRDVPNKSAQLVAYLASQPAPISPEPETPPPRFA